MINILDYFFLNDLIKNLGVKIPEEKINSFEDIYKNIIIQYLDLIEIKKGKERILKNIYFNKINSCIDLSLDKFLGI